jgi:hypothetical protein
MKNFIYYGLITCCLLSCSASKHNQRDGWISLFDGKSLNGWKVGDNAATFSVEAGMIVVHGNTSHLFYNGGEGLQFQKF